MIASVQIYVHESHMFNIYTNDIFMTLCLDDYANEALLWPLVVHVYV